jgi:hypothetical protein
LYASSAYVAQSLIIPITSSLDGLFIEIFPEEMPETQSSSLLQVLKDEEAPLSLWAGAALMYIQHHQHARDASAILQAGCKHPGGNREERVRLLASAGIAHLMQAQQQSGSKRKLGNNDPKDELSSMADNRFTHSVLANAAAKKIGASLEGAAGGFTTMTFGIL